MENIIVLTALYILIIGILYAPKCPAQTATETPINYFPSVEDEPQNVNHGSQNPETESLESSEMAIAPNPASDLKSLSIRALKKLASERKIPRYSNLTKSQLIAAMT